MDFLFSVFFGAGTTAFAYSKMGRRIGYGNTQNLFISLGAIFIFATIVFYTILAFILNV